MFHSVRRVYKYRDDLYKVITVHERPRSYDLKERDPEADRLENNIRRAASMIESYGLCNDWDWFVTLTLDPKKYNRLDLDKFRSDFMRLLRDLRARYGCQIFSLIVPELHENKNGWHMHGLIRGLPLSELRPFSLDEKLSPYLRRKLKAGFPVYDWPTYRDKFGFCDIEPIGCRDAAVRYIRKYISKGLDCTAQAIDSGKHLYFVTRGLKLPEEIERAVIVSPDEALPKCLVSLSPVSSYDWDYGSAVWYQPSKE